MKIKLWLGIVLAGLIGHSLTAPVSAQDLQWGDAESTFEVAEKEDVVALRFGRNLLLAGNDFTRKDEVNGLLFSAGQRVLLQSESDYAFVAGNIVEFDAATERDLFAAGSSIEVKSTAKIGRDAFLAANTIEFKADLAGDLSAAASKITLKDVQIDGDVNLDAGVIAFEGKVEIGGKLSFNDDADIIGLANATYGELEKYENIKYEPTATEILMAKILSIGSLFVVMVIIMALFPGVDKRVSKELTMSQLGKDLVVGICTLFFVPIIIIFLLLSYIGAPAALILLAVYIITLYLAQGFAGYYLGKAIFEKGLKQKMNRFIEAFVGIVIIALCTWFSPLIWLLSAILGLGLIMQSIKPDRKKAKDDISEAQIVAVKPEGIIATKTKTPSESKAVAKSASKHKVKSGAEKLGKEVVEQDDSAADAGKE